MIRTLMTVLVFLSALPSFSQKLSGQWTGGFNSGGGGGLGGQTEYVLELELKGNEVKGYSYTYFNIIGKRYYVICRLTGNYDKASKSVVVKEVEKVKSNTPPDFQDCMQTHYLTYMKGNGKESLVGKWKPTYDKDRCGTGVTELERKQLVKVVPQSTKPPVASKNSPPKTSTAPKTATKTAPPAAKPPTAAAKPSPIQPASPPVASKDNNNKTQTIEKTVPNIEKPKAPSTIVSGPSISKFEKRGKQIVRTIEVDSKTFKVDMYDNGQIDGDTISLYLNGKLMVSRQRLSTTPITLNIEMQDDQNELVMYAENLGTIPPNTALMIVTVGDKRYEVNISSSETTSGAVRFILTSQAKAKPQDP